MNESFPYYIEVTFDDGSPTDKRMFTKGASAAVKNYAQAIESFRTKDIPCTIVLMDHLDRLIIQETIKPAVNDRGLWDDKD